MTRPPDRLPGTLDLRIVRTRHGMALHGWAISQLAVESREWDAIGRVMKLG